MSKMPPKVEQMERALSRLKGHLERNRQAVPPAEAKMLIGYLRHWFTQRNRGELYVHPGNTMVAKWGHCDKSHARRRQGRWREAGFLIAKDDGKGGRGKARESSVDVQRLCEWLRELDAALRADLVGSLLSVDTMTSARCDLPPARKGGTLRLDKGGTKGGTESPPYIESLYSPQDDAVGDSSSSASMEGFDRKTGEVLPLPIKTERRGDKPLPPAPRPGTLLRAGPVANAVLCEVPSFAAETETRPLEAPPPDPAPLTHGLTAEEIHRAVLEVFREYEALDEWSERAWA